MLMQAILESLKDLEQSNTKNVQQDPSDAASKETSVVKDCNGVNDVTLELDASSVSACVTNTRDKHATDCSDEAKEIEVQSKDNRAANGAAPVSTSEPQVSSQISSGNGKSAPVESNKPTQNMNGQDGTRVESQKPTQNMNGEDGTRATLVVQKSRTGGLIDGLTHKWGSFFKNND